jgi:hypothetical protein
MVVQTQKMQTLTESTFLDIVALMVFCGLQYKSSPLGGKGFSNEQT